MLEVKRYKYTAEDGTLLYYQVRYEPKTFRPMMPDGSSQLTVGRVLYRLPQLLEAIRKQSFIYIVEGEKDADRLWDEGMAATTAGSATAWDATDTKPLRVAWGVVAVPDNDDAGEAWLNTVASDLAPWVRSFQVLRLPDMDEHGDVSDCYDAGNTNLGLLRVNAPKWTPPPPKPRPPMSSTKGIGLAYSIDELSQVLKGFRYAGGNATAYCPAHHDTGSKGLSMTELENGRTLVKCWSGCEYMDIVNAIDREMR